MPIDRADPTEDPPALVVEGIKGGYGGMEVVRGVGLTCPCGEIVGIIGPNGAGKSTFLKCVLRLATRYAGRVQIDGLDVSTLRADQLARHGVGYVPQVGNVFPSLTVKENLEICRLLYDRGVHVDEAFSQRIERILSTAPEVKAAWRRPAATLSGGEQKLLAFCRVLVQGSRIIVVDEPTAALSQMYSERIWSWLKNLASGGMAILVVEQNVRLLLESADWVHVLVDGRNSFSGSSADIATRDLAELFFGRSSEDSMRLGS